MTRMFFHLFLVVVCVFLTSCSNFGSEDEDTVSPSEIEGEIDDIEIESADAEENADELEDLDIESSDSSAVAGNSTQDAFEDIEEFNDGMVEAELSSEKSQTAAVSEPADEFDDLDLEAAPVDTSPAVVEAAPSPEIAVPAVAVSDNKITNLEYKSQKSGGSVVISALSPFQYQVREEPEFNQTIIEIADVYLPDQFKLPYIAKDFEQAVATVNAYQNSGSSTARFVIQYKSRLKPSIQMVGNELMVMNSGISSSTYANSVSGQGQPSAKNITIEMQNIEIQDLISYIADEVGINVIIDNAVKGQTSVKLKETPWEEALSIILKTNGLSYERRGNILRIAQTAELTKEFENEANRLVAQDKANSAAQARSVKVIPVNYANLDDLVLQVKPFMSEKANVIVDKRSSSIILNDYDAPLARAEKLIQSLDVQPVQVLIEGKIIEASDSFSREFGIRWGQSGGSSGSGGQKLNFNQTIRPDRNPSSFSGGYLADLTFGTFDGIGDITANLAIYESEEKIKILSSPKIVTLNKEKALIESVTQVVNLQRVVVPNVGIQVTPNFQDAKLSLGVTPQVSFNSDLILDLEVSRDVPGSPIGDETASRAVDKRTAKSKVIVKNGESLVIGGIYSQEEQLLEGGVPLLKDIPILGYLFKTKRREMNKTELLIFLTPKILNPENMLRTTEISSSGKIVKSQSESQNLQKNEFSDEAGEGSSGEVIDEVESL